MSLFVEIIVGFLGAYLLGSVSSAVIISKIFGLQDPRLTGSNNPGATNVLRIGGKLPAALTLLCDALKGFVPIMLGVLYEVPQLVLCTLMIGPVFGHMYPLWFKFKGGKGVATFIGLLLGFSYPLFLMFVVIWGLVFIISRMSSVSALSACFVVCAYGFWGLSNHYALSIFILVVLIFTKHKDNIKRMCSGSELKI